MTEKSPLVFVDGGFSQLPPGDSIDGVVAGSLVAGSGLVGGGDLNTGSKRLDIGLAPNPSGVIFVGDALGLDGVDLATANTALEYSIGGLEVSVPALVSGATAQTEAAVALASGNAALSAAVNFQPPTSLTYTAASAVASGYAVGLDDTGRVQSIRTVGAAIAPTISSRNNFIGTAQATVASGSSVTVLLPRNIDFNQSGLSTGSFYYVNPTTSGFTTASGRPTAWSGSYNWAPVAKAISSSGLLLLDTI